MICAPTSHIHTPISLPREILFTLIVALRCKAKHGRISRSLRCVVGLPELLQPVRNCTFNAFPVVVGPGSIIDDKLMPQLKLGICHRNSLLMRLPKEINKAMVVGVSGGCS